MLVKIPVKPYIRKFLEVHLGKAYELRQDDAFGILLFVLFQKKRGKGERPGSIKRYTDCFQVDASNHQLRKSHYKGLSTSSIVQFNNFAELIFKTEWHGLAGTYHDSDDKSIRQAVDEFMGKFNLTSTDIDPMSLRRSFLRHRQVDKKNLEWLDERGLKPGQ